MLVTLKNNVFNDSLVEALSFQGIPFPIKHEAYEVSDIKSFESGLGVSLKAIPHKLYSEKHPQGINVYWKLDRFKYDKEGLVEFLTNN